MGATRRQMLGKVQLPLARRMLLLGVNQTILFALSMVVIAGLIGGGGLGAVVTSGLYTNPALAILGGIAIVIMAMALDRATEAIADRTDPAKRHLDDEGKQKLRLQSIGVAVVIAGVVAVAKLLGVKAVYPDTFGADEQTATLQEWLLGRIQIVLDFVQNPESWVFGITEPTGNSILTDILLPIQSFLVESPWFATVAGLTLIAFVISGRRPALTVLSMLVLIGVLGVWALAMDTLSQVLVSTLFAVLIGVVLGVWAAESRTVSKILRPINDVLQTLPQLVYIIPFVYLMPVSIVPGIVAGVLYAFPVVVRLVERGVTDVAPETVEAAGAFGATRGQILLKVKIPLAGDAIMLGVNQGIIMVLSVVVIGGLVGLGRARLRGGAGPRAGAVRTGHDRVRRDPRARDRARPGHAGVAAGTSRERVVTNKTAGTTFNRQRSHINREGRMKKQLGGTRGRLAGLALVAVAALAVFAASAFGGSARSTACGDRHLNENAWAGSTSNVYVAKYVLEKKLGCKVKVTNVTENQPSFQAMADGKIDVVLEDWDNSLVAGNQKYMKNGSVVNAGPLGVVGLIGWYIPRYLLDAVPPVQDVEGAEGQGERLQVAGVGLAGDVPRRRPVVRPEGQGDHRGARPRPQARRRGRGAGPGRTLDEPVQAEEARALLLVHAAVPERAVRPRQGGAAAADEGVRGRHDEEAARRRHTPATIRRPSSTS